MPAQGERAQWGRHLEFILTLVGYAVGLGNVWRFPYLAYKSGGGAFLIPYFLCLLLLGIPVFALEVSLGQFGGQGPMTVWDINPAAKGLGMAAMAISSIVMIYYAIVIAWAMRFLIASLTDHLPWEDCDRCACLLYRKEFLDTDNATEIALRNLTTIDKQNETIPFIGDLLVNNSLGLNCTLEAMESDLARSPSEVFFWDRILKVTSGIDETGNLQWELLLCNLAGYIVVFLVLVKGIQSLGKVVYFTATFPYVLLTILLIRGCTLDGAGDGVRYYLEPDWSRLGDAQVWSDAAVQIFFSLSACLGGLIAMSSYNNFNNNCIRDSIVVPLINCLTSFFAGFVVFATLGHMAHVKGTSVDKVTDQGPGLIFVVYPEALSQMPVSPLWAILFFFMVCILGFSTQFSAAETVMTSIVDQFPHTFKSGKRRTLMRASVCLIAFLLGIPMLNGNGQHLLDLVDGAVVGYPVLLVGLMECIVVVVIYGYNEFAEDIKTMLGTRPPFYFGLCWMVISPVLLVGVIVFKAFQETAKEVDWANLLYWLIIVFPISLIPGWWCYYVCTHSKMTRYTPAWRNRRNPNSKVKTDDIEMEVEATGNGGVKDATDTSDAKQEKADNSNNAYDNTGYVHHQEDSKMSDRL